MLTPGRLHRHLIPLAMMLVVTCARSGDISPLVLPNQRQLGTPRPSATETDRREQYYADFKRDMQSRPAAQREELAMEFRKRLAASQTPPERAHYQRLLGILSDIQPAGAPR